MPLVIGFREKIRHNSLEKSGFIDHEEVDYEKNRPGDLRDKDFQKVDDGFSYFIV